MERRNGGRKAGLPHCNLRSNISYGTFAYLEVARELLVSSQLFGNERAGACVPVGTEGNTMCKDSGGWK